MKNPFAASAMLVALIAGLAQSASNIPAPVVRSIQFSGLGSLKVEEILTRWNQQNLDFGIQRHYDPKQAALAGEQIRSLFAERKLGSVKVDVTTAPLPTQALEVKFKISPK